MPGLPQAMDKLRQMLSPYSHHHSNHESWPASLQTSVLKPLLDSDAIAELRQRALRVIDLQMKNQTVLHRQHGEHMSAHRGYGLDYEESRVYQPGDEMRFMNWRLTARTGEAHVKIFREERRPNAFILLDTRHSMRFGTRVRLKVTQALRAAVLLAFYNHYSGRSVSGLVLADHMQWLDSAGDEQSTLGMIHSMNQACPPLSATSNPPDFAAVLRVLQTTLTAGTKVFLLSDFMDATSQCQAALAHLAAKHTVSAIHIVDPAELQLPKAGKLRLSVASLAKSRSVDTSNPKIAADFQGAVQQQLAARESLIRGMGIAYVRLTTTIDSIETAMDFT